MQLLRGAWTLATRGQTVAADRALILGVLAFQLLPLAVQAQMPWDTPVTSFSTSVSGPVRAALIGIPFILFGLAWMFNMHVLGWVVGLVIGGVIAANSEFFVGWLGGGGGGGG